MRSYMAKPAEVTGEWLLIDGAGLPLGRLASQVASLLRGKHKPTYTPHVDGGDFVIVINAEKVVLTGKKVTGKVDWRHSGYIGGVKTTPYSKLMKEKPEYVVKEAVRGMLPKSKLGRAMAKKLKVYRGSEHPHQAQKPREIKLNVSAGKQG